MKIVAKVIGLLTIVCFFSSSVYSYGPAGHAWVGRIADFILADSNDMSQTAQEVRNILHGMSLSTAANIPDRIKSWDRGESFSLPARYADIQSQLRDFWEANKTTSRHSHHDFHYTDISIFDSKYEDNETGAADIDVVHMIPFCVRVLQKKESENNQYRITRAVALILLAHYVGDIHQPLHVGADYFARNGSQVNPDQVRGAFDDQGGNKLTLILPSNPKGIKLHGFWDGTAVNQASGSIYAQIRNRARYRNLQQAAAVAKYFADQEPPAGWRPSGNIDNWARNWADEILPVAKTAHEKLEIGNVRLPTRGHQIVSGTAREKRTNGDSYLIWAGKTTEEEVHKAGWRLAHLLKEALR